MPDCPPVANGGTSEVTPVADERSGRVSSIDALRGVAALMVVLFHLEGAISRTASGWLWAPVESIVRHGYLGVDIFFVISGFVIALSVSRGAPTIGYFGRFVVRRSIRLDPPYWVAIGLELLLLLATQRLLPDREVVFPSGPQVAAHFLYLQELLGYGSIVTIFWTLCYEIQFYAFYVGLTVIRAYLPRPLRAGWIVVMCLAALFILSLWTRYWPPSWLPVGLAINRWFQFFIGVLTWRAISDPRNSRTLYAAWIVLTAAVLLAQAPLYELLTVAVSALVLGIVKFPSIGRPLRTRPLLFLGSISYSLYLFHTSVGWRFVSVTQLIWPGPWSPAMALATYAAGVVLCVVFSAVLWRLVERPLLALSRRVRLPLRADMPTQPTSHRSEVA